LLLIFSNQILACTGLSVSFSLSSTGCGIPQSISISNSSTGANASTTSFIWKINGVRFDSTYSTTPGTFYSALTPGTYIFNVIAKTASGCYDSSVNHTITVTTKAPAIYDGLGNLVYNPVWTNCIMNPLASNAYSIGISSNDTLNNYTIIWGDA